MKTDVQAPDKYLEAARAIFSSLRLKDVLDTIVHQCTKLVGAGKVAVYLADNESKSFKLMAAKGYEQQSLQEMKMVPFTASGIFLEMLNKRRPVVLKLGNQ